MIPTRTRSLDYFLNNLNREGLAEMDVQKSEEFISKLYEATGSSWRPNNCMYLPTDKANQVWSSNPRLHNFFKEIKDKRYKHVHFFWTSETPNGIFIIDPTGVPTTADFLREDFESHITPYFGLLENSTFLHEMVYSQMEDLDDWGKRDLPPGFHP